MLLAESANFIKYSPDCFPIRQIIQTVTHQRVRVAGKKRGQNSKGADPVFRRKAEGIQQTPGIVQADFREPHKLFAPGKSLNGLGRNLPELDWFTPENAAQSEAQSPGFPRGPGFTGGEWRPGSHNNPSIRRFPGACRGRWPRLDQPGERQKQAKTVSCSFFSPFFEIWSKLFQLL